MNIGLYLSAALPTIEDALRRGEPIVFLPPEELQPEMTLRADQLWRAGLAESRDWGHVNLGLQALHDRGVTGKGTLVAICDTGIDTDHPDLKSRVRQVGNRDFTGSPSGFQDRQGHGTHCAGIAAAARDDQGIMGAAPEAELIAVKVLSDQGSGASSWIAAGIKHAADQGADVISLSLGGPQADPYTRGAVQYAASKGAWVVIAAGNDGGPATSYPGHWPESCCVAATDKENRRASFSTINAQNDVSAPGVNIWSTLPNARYGSMSGTSMATPYVAGCLALVRSALKAAGRPVPPQAEMLAALKVACTDLGNGGHDSSYGWGLMNPAKLIEVLVGQQPPPPAPPPVTPPPGGAVKTWFKGVGMLQGVKFTGNCRFGPGEHGVLHGTIDTGPNGTAALNGVSTPRAEAVVGLDEPPTDEGSAAT